MAEETGPEFLCRESEGSWQLMPLSGYGLGAALFSVVSPFLSRPVRVGGR